MTNDCASVSLRQTLNNYYAGSCILKNTKEKDEMADIKFLHVPFSEKEMALLHRMKGKKSWRDLILAWAKQAESE